MKKRKQIRITVETERVLRFSHPVNRAVWCLRCGDETRMLSVDEAALLAQVKAMTIYRSIEAGTLHYTETPSGALLVCATSLKNLSSTWEE